MAGRSTRAKWRAVRSAGSSTLKKYLTPPTLSEMPPDDAARTEDRQGRHGAETGGSFVLDATQGMGLRAVDKVRFARGTTWKSLWCEVKHRVIDWGIPLPFAGEFEVVIMIERVTEEMHGSN